MPRAEGLPKSPIVLSLPGQPGPVMGRFPPGVEGRAPPPGGDLRSPFTASSWPLHVEIL